MKEKVKTPVITVLKGLWVGGTMTVPGVSGGSMAMILGIYDKLIFALNTLFHSWKSVWFLACFLGGSVTGMFLFSQLVLNLLTRWPMPVKYFFLGAVAGGIPMIYRAANGEKERGPVWQSVLWVVLGIVLVFLISLIPEGLFTPGSATGLGGIALQLAGGVIVAIALVLPGISVSQMLLMLGLYEDLIAALGRFDILPYLPLIVGCVGGIFLSARVLAGALRHHPRAAYLTVLGFLLGSLPDLAPGLPTGWTAAVCVLTATAGFSAVYAVSRATRN